MAETAKVDTERFQSFSEFFPYYLAEHANPTCRKLHYIGTSLGMLILAFAIATQQWGLMILFPLTGYGFAWVGHFKFERNKPATFKYPFWSLLGDYKMLWLALTGKLTPQLHAGIKLHGKKAHS